MKRINIMMLCLLALCALPMAVSCTEDIEHGGVDTPSDIEFNIDNAGNWTRGGANTRGSQATVSSLSSGFGVSASVYPTAGSYGSNPCGNYFYKISATPNTATNYYWPLSTNYIAFYAYYPYGNDALTMSAKDANGIPTYAYTVPQALASHVDVMTAQVLDRSCSNTSPVSLSFGHRLTDIRFLVYNQQNDDLTVKTIAIHGVKYAGTWQSGSSWSLTGSVNSSSSHPFTLTANATVTSEATVDVTSTANHFIMIPQTIAANTNLFVIKTTEDGEERTYTYTVPAGGITWEMGKCYTYTLTLGNGSLTVSSVSVIDWEPITTVAGAFSVNNWTAE